MGRDNSLRTEPSAGIQAISGHLWRQKRASSTTADWLNPAKFFYLGNDRINHLIGCSGRLSVTAISNYKPLIAFVNIDVRAIAIASIIEK